ncbi:acyl carrier protein [Streptomyces sp. NPDC007205]|uniref:acyl carrier protein n=1 Tax=Streptomyces sp. NPDC007205 TaxID=3154316 RepID=UPI0033FDAFC8
MSDRHPDVVPTTDEPNRPLPPDDGQLLAELRTLYAEELEYPEEVVTNDAHFEAELGIDSLTQVVTLVRVLERYGMHSFVEKLPATEYPTLRAVAELLRTLADEEDAA